MKSSTFTFAGSILFCYLLVTTACHRDEIPQYTIEFTQGDGTRESYALFAGSMLLVHDGEMHMVVKTAASDISDELALDVTNYSVAHDTLKGEYTIQKSGASSQKISVTKSALLDPSGSVQVNLQSVTMQKQAAKDPKGACKGICCEAKCFSTYCCADPDECKNKPCDCKPPQGCLVTHTAIQATHFFELNRSGKELIVVKN